MHYGDCVGNRLCTELMNASSLQASRESNLLVFSVIAVSENNQNNSRVWGVECCTKLNFNPSFLTN